MTNTERPTTKAEMKKQGKEKISKQKIENPKIKQEPKTIEKEKNIEEKQEIKKSLEKEKKDKPKKTEAFVRGTNVPISTKHSIAICRFIKKKKIEKAIQDLEQVALLKKAVPMKGEIPHRKGKMSSGRFPQKAAKNFIILLKSLAANSSEIENPIILEAISNVGTRPYGKFGRVKKKRTNIKIIAKDKKSIKLKKRKK